MDEHHYNLVSVESDFVVGGPSVEAVKEKLKVAVIRVVVVDGGGEGDGIHKLSPSTGVCHGVAYRGFAVTL